MPIDILGLLSGIDFGTSVLLNATAGLWAGPIGPRQHGLFVLETAINMGLAASLAVYGSHRIEALRRQASEARQLGPYRLMRADLALVMNGDDRLAADVARFVPGRVGRCTLRPEPVEPLPGGARVALLTTGATSAEGVDPAVASTNLARRSDLAADLERASAAGCDVFLTEIKAAGIDTVAAFARERGARVVFLRNRPVGLDIDLDAELIRLHDDA